MIKLTSRAPEKYKGDMLVYFVCQQKKGLSRVDNRYVRQKVKQVSDVGDFTGKEGQGLLDYPAKASGLAVGRLLVVGMGKEKELGRESFRKAGGTVVQKARQTKAGNIMVVIPESMKFNPAEMVECLTEGLVLGAYQFKKYKSNNDDDEEPAGTIEEISLAGRDTDDSKRAVRAGVVAAEAGCAVRDMANEPGNQWTPTSFAEYGLTLAKKYDLSCTVLAKAEMRRLKMGGILGVNSGSAQPPKMVIVSYSTSKKNPTLLLVGKGLTFDSGGISIKPGAGMQEMKYDMCGGAAVLATMQAVGEEKPKGINVTAIVPATENLPGPSALKPGDIITMYGGKNVEVQNTDAEGRLILADALAYGIEKFKPDAVIDLATLTGAVVIGLGHHRTGLLSNNDALVDKIMAAGERSGEPLWRLPLGPEYSKQIRSDVADIKNVGNRSGGTITAAAFLQEFVGDTHWAHLDIAGTAYNFTKKSYIPKGPSGTGARTLLDLIRNWK